MVFPRPSNLFQKSLPLFWRKRFIDHQHHALSSQFTQDGEHPLRTHVYLAQLATLAQSCLPLVAWRLEWISGEVDRLWPEGVPQIRNEYGSAYVTGYVPDEAGNLVYLGIVGHKTVLDSIRATVQARQRKKLFMQGRAVYPLATHCCQTWQHLPDYGSYHATLIADAALPGKWQSGEKVAYILVFEGDLANGENLEEHACQMLPSLLSEALSMPIHNEWADALWNQGMEKELISTLERCGDCLFCCCVHLFETKWAEIVVALLKEGVLKIASFE
jgi:hypothetical protein